MILPAIAIGLAINTSNPTGANASGTVAGTAVDPTDPVQARLIELLRAAVDPNAEISQQKVLMDQLKVETASYRDLILNPRTGEIQASATCQEYHPRVTAYWAAPFSEYHTYQAQHPEDKRFRPSVEGGNHDRHGQSHTLEEYLAGKYEGTGKNNYISIAADYSSGTPIPDFVAVYLPDIENDPIANPTHKLLVFRHTDDGGAFHGTKATHIDVAVRYHDGMNLSALGRSHETMYVGDSCARAAINTVASGATLTDSQQQQITLLDKVDSDIDWIRTYANNPKASKTPDYALHITKLTSDIQAFAVAHFGKSLGLDTVNAVIAYAKQVVDQNNDGHGSLTYQSFDPVLGHKRDCSGFISGVLTHIGVLRGYTTFPPHDSRFEDLTSKIVTHTDSDKIQQDVLTAAKNGILKPGDIIHSGTYTGTGTGDGHFVLYIGPNFDSPKNVVESTHANGKNGPQYSTLQNRMQNGGTVSYIYRPSY